MPTGSPVGPGFAVRSPSALTGRSSARVGERLVMIPSRCYEIDLVALLESGTEREFRYFAAFFSAQAFAPDVQGRSFLERALEESTANAVAVGRALEAQVFDAVPLIAQGLLGEDERSRPAPSDAFDHALVLLYRLLFLPARRGPCAAADRQCSLRPLQPAVP